MHDKVSVQTYLVNTLKKLQSYSVWERQLHNNFIGEEMKIKWKQRKLETFRLRIFCLPGS
jgi:hypothetical protein